MDNENTNWHKTREKTNSSVVDRQSLCKARFIAFYLPQFHPIPENNEWWGKGFTEWTNVTKAKPLFRGHYQPRIPADLGFYDLRLPEVRAAQADLAREYGIEGFCYWHYWFAGDRLLERPFNEVLKSGEPRFPFCLAWANESWTGIWYGAPNRILKAQTYPGPKDYEAHFYTLLRAFADTRYINVDGKPLLMIFRPLNLPNPRNVTDFWRNLAHKEGLKGLHLVAQLECDQHEGWDATANGFDAVTLCNQSKILQLPSKNRLSNFRRRVLENSKIQEFCTEILQRPFRVFRYEDAVPYFVMSGHFDFEYYPSVIPGWDNTPRAGLKGLVLHNSTPELFRKNIRQALDVVQSKPKERRIVFIKSWNEWAEGNYLEPDQRFGKKYLEAIKEEIIDSASDSPALAGSATTADFGLAIGCASNAKNVLDAKKPRWGLIGVPFTPIGIGEHLRCGARALSAVGTTVGIVPLQGTACDDLDVKHEIESYVVQQLSPEINIFYINGDMVEQSLREVHGLLPKSSYNIVYPMWELSRYPKYWAEQLNRFDEIWAPSKFTYDSIKPAITKPVVHMSLPGEIALRSFLDRRYFNIPESSFAFLFFFDFTSYLERKNPFAVLRAFEELCKRSPKEDLCLIIKLKGGETKEKDYRIFCDYISRFNGRLLIIDKVLTDNEIKNLLRCCDCFVSLHRSEGFGLGLINAMFLGKPVVATAYSANMDFMTEANSCLVRYELCNVPDGAYPFFEGQVWADPDIEHAVDHMVKLVSDRDYARELGRRASQHIRVNFSYRAIGLRYRDRIREILA